MQSYELIILARMTTELQQLKQENARLKFEQQQQAAMLLQKNAIVEQQNSLLAEQSATICQQNSQIEEWQKKYNDLYRKAYEKNSERYLGDPRQMALDFGDTAEANDAADGLQQAIDEKQLADEAAAVPVRRKPKKKNKGNGRLPENLPRIEVIVDVPDSDKTCKTHGEKTLLGYDTQETLVHFPPKLEVRVTKFPGYACPNQPDCGVIQADRPAGRVRGNRYDTSVAAEIITAKYGFHLPYYRQQDRHCRMEWSCRSTAAQTTETSAESMPQSKDSLAVAGLRVVRLC